MMVFKSTKSYRNFPCTHQQWRDCDITGEPGTGQCAKTHGYSREVHFEFTANEVDEYGWVVGFGSLKPVKNWLTWLFDHTSLWEAGDPRIQDIINFNNQVSIPIYNMRVLPTGVSMEQTALFLSMHLNPYILSTTGGRCWISRLEVRENDKNSGIIEFDYNDALAQQRYFEANNMEYFPNKTLYEYQSPKSLLNSIFNT